MAVFAGGKARLAGCCGSGRGDLHSLPGDCLRQAALEIYRRLMDAVEPAPVDEAEQALRATGGVLDTGQVRMRRIGHQIRAECEVIVGPGITAVQAHQVTPSRGWPRSYTPTPSPIAGPTRIRSLPPTGWRQLPARGRDNRHERAAINCRWRQRGRRTAAARMPGPRSATDPSGAKRPDTAAVPAAVADSRVCAGTAAGRLPVRKWKTARSSRPAVAAGAARSKTSAVSRWTCSACWPRRHRAYRGRIQVPRQPSPLTERTDSAPPQMGTTFGCRRRLASGGAGAMRSSLPPRCAAVIGAVEPSALCPLPSASGRSPLRRMSLAGRSAGRGVQ